VTVVVGVVTATTVVAPITVLGVVVGEEVVAPRVPEIVAAPAGIEEPSATRFHFLNLATGITGGTVPI
jgi:hypothetical protein